MAQSVKAGLTMEKPINSMALIGSINRRRRGGAGKGAPDAPASPMESRQRAGRLSTTPTSHWGKSSVT
jgi:hypothetical protein